MRILHLMLKDLSQMLRDRRSLLFIVVMPIIMTLFMGLAYGGASGGDAKADTRIPLAVVDAQPDAILNRALLSRLNSSSAVRIVPLDEAGAMDALYKGEVDGVLIVPSNFSEQGLSGGDAAGQIPQLKLIAESNSAQGQSLYQLLRGPVSQLMSAAEIGKISAESQANPAEILPAFELAWNKWDANARIDLVRTEQAVAQKNNDWTGGNPFNQASPGILVMFAIFGLTTSAQILVQERQSRTLQRLMTTAMHPWEMVAGHLLAMFALSFLQTLLLVIFGQFAFHVEYLREPVGTLLVGAALSLWVASVGLLIGVLAKEEQQVVLFSMLAMFVFSALGGTWFPIEMAGGAFAAIGRVMPSSWAMTGLQNILIRGLDLESTLMPASVLLAYAALFFTLAVLRFRKMEV